MGKRVRWWGNTMIMYQYCICSDWFYVLMCNYLFAGHVITMYKKMVTKRYYFVCVCFFFSFERSKCGVSVLGDRDPDMKRPVRMTQPLMSSPPSFKERRIIYDLWRQNEKRANWFTLTLQRKGEPGTWSLLNMTSISWVMACSGVKVTKHFPPPRT